MPTLLSLPHSAHRGFFVTFLAMCKGRSGIGHHARHAVGAAILKGVTDLDPLPARLLGLPTHLLE